MWDNSLAVSGLALSMSIPERSLSPPLLCLFIQAPCPAYDALAQFRVCSPSVYFTSIASVCLAPCLSVFSPFHSTNPAFFV